MNTELAAYGVKANLNIYQQVGTANPLETHGFSILPSRNNITRLFQIALF